MTNVFGELRSLLDRPQSRGVWEDLCAVVETADPETYDQELAPYVQDRLADWPDALRRAPSRWLWRRVQEDTPEPWLGLCRRLDATQYTLRALSQDPQCDLHAQCLDGARRLLTMPFLEGITDLRMHRVGWENLTATADAITQAFLTCDALSDVRTLELRHCFSVRQNRWDLEQTRDMFAVLAASPLMRSLQTLHTHHSFRGYHQMTDFEPTWLQGLTELRSLRFTSGLLLDPTTLTLPALESLHIEHIGPHIARPDALPALRHLSFEVDDTNVSAWCRFLHERPLTSLSVRTVNDYAWDTRQGERLIAALPETLNTLTLTGLPPEVVGPLGASASLGALTSLTLVGCEIRKKVAGGFLGRLEAPRLTHLALRQSRLTAKTLAGIERFPGLTHLEVAQRAKLQEAGAARLAALDAPLEALSLDRATLGPEGAQTLFAGTALEGVRALDLTGAGLGEAGVRALTACTALGALEVLHLGTNRQSNDLDAASMERLAAWPGLAALKVLSLERARLSTDALLPLLRAPMPALEALNLNLNEVGAQGVRALCENPSLRGLRALSLAKASLDHEAIEALMAGAWPRLGTLVLHDNDLRTPAHDIILAARLPRLEWFDAGLEFLDFVGRRRDQPLTFVPITEISHSGLTGDAAARYVCLT